jgi:cytidylate kinase
MENLLLKYFEARIKQEKECLEPGPVITISRECGCPSKILADILTDKLREIDRETASHPFRWRWIGRELLEEAARDLKVAPKDIDHVFTYNERTVIDDILAATKRDGSYKPDHAIKRSVGKVIRAYAECGHVVIVGRAGVALNRDIEKSLHVRLIAPLEWRLEQVMKIHNQTREQALDWITKKDSNRKRFLEYYLGQKFQIHIFDLVYNCATITLEQIAESIILSARLKKLI